MNILIRNVNILSAVEIYGRDGSITTEFRLLFMFFWALKLFSIKTNTLNV